MRALPESWQNDLLKSVQGVTPETTRKLLPLLELVERSPPSGAMPPIPKKEKAADVPLSGSKRRGGKHGGGVECSRQKGGLTLNRCKHCENHGGPVHTHATEKCFKILMARPSPPKLERIRRPTRLLPRFSPH
jgi:hypothetical protein